MKSSNYIRQARNGVHLFSSSTLGWLAASIGVVAMVSGITWIAGYNAERKLGMGGPDVPQASVRPIVTKLSSFSGSSIESFFEGLPSNPQLANGNSSSSPRPRPPCVSAGMISPAFTRLQRFVGLGAVVHAQDCSSPCYQDEIDDVPCGPPCGGSYTYTQYNSDPAFAGYGSYSTYGGCMGICDSVQYFSCDSYLCQ
jgi:hypothetical protein